jgi:hypothetical protein
VYHNQLNNQETIRLKQRESEILEVNLLKQEVSRLKYEKSGREGPKPLPISLCRWCQKDFTPSAVGESVCAACTEWYRTLSTQGCAIFNAIFDRLEKLKERAKYLEDRGCDCHCESDYND